jgi:SAM-dependent methyltransferase
VPDGRVTGIDVVADVLEEARELASDNGVANATFEQGDVYALAYEDDSFDVAYAHQVLQHLTDPTRALRELRRVLKPGGLVAIREVDYGTMIHAPDSPELVHWLELYHRVASRNGAEADAGRYLNGWLLDAGFEAIEMSASTWVFHQPPQLLNWGDSWAERTTESAFAEQAVEYGLATADELETIADGWRRWARSPNAFFSFLHVEGLGRPPDGS